MPRTAGISGTAVGLATAGGLLLYAGLKGVSVVDALRQVVATGTLPAGGPASATLGTPNAGPYVPGAATGSAIADAALKYEGTPYKWGGADPSGWDCSGFVTWVLHHDLGYDLPDNVHTPVSVPPPGFLYWSGATRVSGPFAGCLVVWPGVHIGIAISPTQMISAENPSRGTRVDTFASGGPGVGSPIFLQVNARPRTGFN